MMARRMIVLLIAILAATLACDSSNRTLGSGAQSITVGPSAGADFVSIQAAVTAVRDRRS